LSRSCLRGKKYNDKAEGQVSFFHRISPLRCEFRASILIGAIENLTSDELCARGRILKASGVPIAQQAFLRAISQARTKAAVQQLRMRLLQYTKREANHALYFGF
jgi:hypothetical protein